MGCRRMGCRRCPNLSNAEDALICRRCPRPDLGTFVHLGHLRGVRPDRRIQKRSSWAKSKPCDRRHPRSNAKGDHQIYRRKTRATAPHDTDHLSHGSNRTIRRAPSLSCSVGFPIKALSGTIPTKVVTPAIVNNSIVWLESVGIFFKEQYRVGRHNCRRTI